ncbi:MAG: GIY-YIG nuclease family protein [Cylindrospermopsis raciborskii KL1]|jgi:hypothetical protein|uniref:GIY-YIG nuclease family protein n=1 Tax=Cylindrospermopsis raciborskii TaxID=77022 RepID=UPI001A185F35|nr:GIY-YIG nuclease family protein [Cylindrospermopsis raciborskii]MBG0742062.1 GIY-YIG nuclease family protein [Cylindrospermopsis raciborskii KL1]
MNSNLENLEFIDYIDHSGELPIELEGKIGVYAIFNQEKILQFIGYSRDVYLSCKQHLVRQPHKCYWLKVHTIERPDRKILSEIENSWIAQNGSLPPGNGEHKQIWTNAINVQELMTDTEKENYHNPLIDDLAKTKVLKNVSRRVESEILELLTARGLKTQIRFNPKLKEEGLLDLK